MSALLSALSTIDPALVERLLDAAFGHDRHQRTAYLLRQGVRQIETLSFGLMDGDALVGTIQCWPVALTSDNEMASMILVGPVAIAPDRQNTGLGRQLMRAMLDASATMGHPPLTMIGDPEYYGRFGFRAEGTAGWSLPGPWEPHRLLLRNDGGTILPATGMLGPDTGNMKLHDKSGLA